MGCRVVGQLAVLQHAGPATDADVVVVVDLHVTDGAETAVDTDTVPVPIFHESGAADVQVLDRPAVPIVLVEDLLAASVNPDRCVDLPARSTGGRGSPDRRPVRQREDP